MSTEDAGQEVPVGDFGGVPNAWLPDLGKIAVSSGRIEFAAYQIAVALDLKQPRNGRSRNFSSQCEDIRQRLEDPWRPAWLRDPTSWSEDVAAWTIDATTAMNQHRNTILHRPYFHQRTNDDWLLKTMRRLDDFSSTVPASHREIVDAVERLRPIAGRGIDLWIAGLRTMPPEGRIDLVED
ncbi:hypothetical protein [Occultella gossypii]|uniref:hypothetical protein n=1 Tax=Occultella gossypii TaxID=2800820 RepID=UPI001CC0F1D7|nr:hypothetical protein [Occultella gossypii]